MKSNEEKVTLTFTSEQRTQLARASGITLKEITVNLLLLKLGAAFALRAQSQTLLISDSPDALNLMREGGTEKVETAHFLFSFALDLAQQQFLREISGRDFEFAAIIPDDYLVSYPEAWDKAPFPVEVGRSLIIANADQVAELPASGERQIVALETGEFAGFGTGAHLTTQMCLELIEENLVAGQQILEVGTGSGVLAIACARLGATSVVASDNDEAAVRAARRNVQVNGLQAVIQIESGTLANETSMDEAKLDASAVRQYDLILGNLFPLVLKPLFPEFARRLKPAGRLIISGVAGGREADVVAAWQRAGFALVERRQRGPWLAFVLELRGEGRQTHQVTQL